MGKPEQLDFTDQCMGWGGGGRGRERGLHSDRTLELGRGSPLITQFGITQPVCVGELPEARKGSKVQLPHGPNYNSLTAPIC